MKLIKKPIWLKNLVWNVIWIKKANTNKKCNFNYIKKIIFNIKKSNMNNKLNLIKSNSNKEVILTKNLIQIKN